MSTEAFEFEYTKTVKVPLVDAHGRPIRIGSVLRHLKDNCHGVVSWIGYPSGHQERAGEWCSTELAAVGDIEIKISAGSSRVTNQYSNWEHVPHDQQTHWERFTSWKYRPYDHDDDRQASHDEGLAIDGILALLPSDTVDWEYGPWPDRIEDALEMLANHLSHLKR